MPRGNPQKLRTMNFQSADEVNAVLFHTAVKEATEVSTSAGTCADAFVCMSPFCAFGTLLELRVRA